MSQPSSTNSDQSVSKATLKGLLLKWLLIPALVAIVVFIMQRSIALIGLDLHHDTLMFGAARQFLNGEIPYRDFFYQYNLGTVFFHALALNELGEYIASLKIATAMAYASIAVLIYICGSTAHHWRWALAAALVWSILSPFHMPAVNGYHPWSSVYMMAAVMAGGLCLTYAISGRPMQWAVLAGACFNLAFWFKQVAALQILTVLTWIVYNALRTSVSPSTSSRFRCIFFGLALGGLATSFPFFFYIFKNAIFEDWWNSAFVFNGYFAASGNSAKGFFELARTFFPVNRELGYISIVWSLLPLLLIAIITQRKPDGVGCLLTGKDDRSLISSIFAVLSIAGWIEYFPLAHSFHTQLFMAPMFVLLVLHLDQIKWKSQIGNKARWPTFALLFLTIAALFYQTHWHIRGLHKKVTATYVSIPGESPSSGLSLSPEHALSYNNFYQSLMTARESANDHELIPMSVDSLRALLPMSDSISTDFRMGLNWTFPNEIVEPGFNKRLALRIAQRKSPVYADSLIAIPGYVPVSILEMPSPITKIHTLYVPSTDKQVDESPVYIVSDEFLELDSTTFTKTEDNLVSKLNRGNDLAFINFNKLAALSPGYIKELHISILRSRDIPSYLSKFQYELYLKAVPGNLAARVAELYQQKNNSRYELKRPLKQGQMLDLAKFMLSQGKLFEGQNFPLYFSTLSSSNRPILATKQVGDNNMQIFWSKPSLEKHQSVKMKSDKMVAQYFLAMPTGDIDKNEETIFYIQIMMKDFTSHNFHLHYLPL